MQKFKSALPIVLLFLIFSCNTRNALMGKKLYVLDVKLDAVTIAEYELNFITLDKVEITTMISCNSFECITRKSGESLAIRNYVYKDDFLQIEGIRDASKITFESSGNVKSNTGEILYSTSILEASNDERKERISNYFKGNTGLAKLFLELLKNDAPKSLIQNMGDGTIKLN